MTIPFDLAERGSAHTGSAVRAFAGRILDAPSISASDFARVPTAYNAEGLIVAARDATTAGAVGSALRDVLAEFSCAADGPDWLTGDRASLDANRPPGVLASGVRIVPGDGTFDGGRGGGPDPWSVVQELRRRLGPERDGSVTLNHLMTSAEQVGGNPFALGHGRIGLDGYGVSGAGGHGPVTLTVQPPRTGRTGRRPRVVVLDTGVGDHPWFAADPPDTTIRFDDGRVVGPDVASGRRRDALLDSPTDDHDTAAVDPLLGSLPTHTGHGTFIAGLLRQTSPDADIVALVVMQANGIVPEHKLIRALDVVRSRQRESPGWADAIVLSLGYYAETGEDVRYTSGLKEILLDLGRLGVAVFAAAGNDASSRPSYPAAFAIDPEFADPAVLPLVSVAALGPDGAVAPFSNDGPWVTGEATGVNLVSASPGLPDGGAKAGLAFLGPGGRVRSLVDPDDFRGFAAWSGTSFAAPVLAGRYLNSLIASGFPAGNTERRELLPIGRRSRPELAVIGR
jgi:hypothetical protein